MINAALGESKTVLNIGAGAGSYEPKDRYVVAIEPSATMRAQRPSEAVPAMHGYAENLPFDDRTFDACMATVTVHQWSDWRKGMAEARRVARERIVILAFDPLAIDAFWLAEYAPELIDAERKRYQPIPDLVEALGGNVRVETVPIPLDCTDGFTEAFYGRPERFLQPEVRRSQSAWTFIAPEMQDLIVQRLESDLKSGEWDAKFGYLRTQEFFLGSLRLITQVQSNYR